MTWKGLEPDKCASAWLIARFVDQNARFVMVKKGEQDFSGVSFDTPQAAYRTTHQGTTLDALCQAYGVNLPGVIRIRRIIADIELNRWEDPLTKEREGIKALINGLREKEGQNVNALRQSFVLFDWLYAYYEHMRQ